MNNVPLMELCDDVICVLAVIIRKWMDSVNSRIVVGVNDMK